jgi:hypothetical protein
MIIDDSFSSSSANPGTSVFFAPTVLRRVAIRWTVAGIFVSSRSASRIDLIGRIVLDRASDRGGHRAGAARIETSPDRRE